VTLPLVLGSTVRVHTTLGRRVNVGAKVGSDRRTMRPDEPTLCAEPVEVVVFGHVEKYDYLMRLVDLGGSEIEGRPNK